MGYYTSYTLEVKGIRDKRTYESIVDDMNRRGILQYALIDMGYHPSLDTQCFDSFEPTTWYRHEEDMSAIAASNPDLTFKLVLIGETLDGCAIQYFHGKQTEVCFVEFQKPKNVVW